MTTENYTSTILTASEGFYLTQIADVELSQRVVASKVTLSKFSTADDWKEISKAEGDEIINAQNELRAAEIEAADEN